MALQTSHGYESPFSKLLMRTTVIVSDALGQFSTVPGWTPSHHALSPPPPAALAPAVYLPACVACAMAFYARPRDRLVALVSMALNPALLVIDHGHFQYNCISLGLAVRDPVASRP